MRTEAEIIKQVLDMAVDDPAVRAVIRTNLLPQRDYLHLYEFFFVVSDVEKTALVKEFSCIAAIRTIRKCSPIQKHILWYLKMELPWR